ncbi:hypothetical protein Tco_0666421, partial [Tanacetum coccineum]
KQGVTCEDEAKRRNSGAKMKTFEENNRLTKRIAMAAPDLNGTHTHPYLSNPNPAEPKSDNSMIDLVKTPNVNTEQLGVLTFPYSLVGEAHRWWVNEGNSMITSWEEIVDKFFYKYYPLSRTSRMECTNIERESHKRFMNWLSSKLKNPWKLKTATKNALWNFWEKGYDNDTLIDDKESSDDKSNESDQHPFSNPYQNDKEKEKDGKGQAALRSKQGVHANVRQATPAWTNSNRVNKANQFTPRPVQLNNIRPNLSTASNTIKTGRVNANTGHGNVSFWIHPLNHMDIEPLLHKPRLRLHKTISGASTILNTLSPLGKFDGKSDEGFLVGYSVNSKAFRVYNLVTKRVEVNLHVNFLEEKPNVQGIGHRWMFDLDYLTDSMNYIPVSLQNQANPAGSKEVIDIDVQTEEDADLMVVSSTSLSEKIATKKTHPEQPSSTPISKSADDIMTFRKELDALALKHLGPVPTTVPTSTNPVNTGSSNLNTAFEEVNTGNTEAISPSADHEEEVFSDADDDESLNVPAKSPSKDSQAHPQRKISEASEDGSWLKLMQKNCCRFKLQQQELEVIRSTRQAEHGRHLHLSRQVSSEILKEFDPLHVKAAITP